MSDNGMMFDFGIRDVVPHRLGIMLLWGAQSEWSEAMLSAWFWHHSKTGWLSRIEAGSANVPFWGIGGE